MSRMLVAAFAILAIAGCKEKAATEGGSTAEVKAPAQAAEKVEFAMHIMSQCPFGAQVQKGFAPALEKLGAAVDFKMEFIGDEPTPGNLTSMHGANEVAGNKYEICAIKHAPADYMKMVVCMANDMRNIPKNVDQCATEAKFAPELTAKIKACAEGDEGTQLLSASYKLSKDKGARGSPTMFLNGKKYQGGRTDMDFLRAICGEYKTAKPAACQGLPEPKKVPVVVLSDKRCANCFPDRILRQLENMFPGLESKSLDYMDAEGKAMYDSLKDKGIKMLPAFLFDPIVAEDPGYEQVKRFMSDAGQYKLLQIGAKFDPTAEICDNKLDDDGNSKIDCEDPGCAGQMVCREAIDKNLKVFVMSQCPFGVKALNAMEEVLTAFKDDGITFEVHYIASENPDGTFKSLHGQPEVDENIRELCAIKHYPKLDKATGLPEYMKYVLCRNKDIRSKEWQKCAVDGVKADVIEKCFSGDEGKKLHAEDIKDAQSLGIGASPTWLANNKFQFSGVAPEQIKKNFCAYNKDLKGCAKTLSEGAQGTGGGGSCK